MPNRRTRRLVCFHCAVPLKKDHRDHYGYQCHDCVVREHELVLTLARDPEHQRSDHTCASVAGRIADVENILDDLACNAAELRRRGFEDATRIVEEIIRKNRVIILAARALLPTCQSE